MDILKCECCGNNHLVEDGEYYRCEYCGAVYKKEYRKFEPQLIRVETFQSPVDILQHAIVVPDYIARNAESEEIAQFVYHEIAHSIATSIAEYMDIKFEHDPATMEYRAKGRLRVVRPGENVKFRI